MLRLLPLLLVVVVACADPGETTPPPDALPPPATLSADTTAAPLAPDVVLPTLAGDSLRLAELRGRVVLVNFWATWCAPCRVEIPDLAALHTELADEGLTVVGVALEEDGPTVVAPFVAEHAIPYPIALDDGTAAGAFGGVLGLPTTFIIAPDGRVVRRLLGIFRPEEMRPLLDALLAQRT